VGAEAGAGEEAEPGPFAELGEQVAGLDVELACESRPLQARRGPVLMMAVIRS